MASRAKRKPPTTHKLCGKTLELPPSLCMGCFRAQDIKRAVAAERRRIFDTIRKAAIWYPLSSDTAECIIADIKREGRKGGRGER